jgi:hypothetical protein
MSDARASQRLLSLSRAVAIFLLALAPARAQVTAGEEDLLSRSGKFPAIAEDGRGGFVVVWTDAGAGGQDVFGSVLPPGGGSPGPRFQVNAATAGTQGSPEVAIGPDGDFMVVWQGGTFTEPGGDGDFEGVFRRTFSPSGIPRGPQRRLSQAIRYAQMDPRVAAEEDGGFVAVWDEQRPIRPTVKARRFSAAGEPLGGDLPMEANGEYNNGSLVAAYPGGFAVGWGEGFGCSGGRGETSRGAIARFDPEGRQVNGVYRVGDLECGKAGTGPAMMAGSRAGMLVIFLGRQGLGPQSYFAQRYAPSGQRIPGQFPLSRQPICSGNRCGFTFSAAMDDSGRFALVWDVRDGLSQKLFVQAFSPGGKPLTGRILVNSNPSAFSSSSSAVALANDGTLAVVWQREGAAARRGLFVRRFQLP